MRRAIRFVDLLGYLGLGVATLFFLIPVYWLIIASIKIMPDQMTYPPILVPTRITLDYYDHIFFMYDYLRIYANSLVIALGSTGLSIVVGVPLAYALSRFDFGRFRGKSIALFILSMRFAPPIVALIPIVFFLRTMGLGDTHLGMILAYTSFNLPFTIWIMRGFFNEIPREIEEAAQVDGCGTLRSFFKLVLPLSAGGIAATAILDMIFSWNEFLYANFLTSQNSLTLPVIVSGFVGEAQAKVLWGEMAAAGTLALIPVLVFAMVLQKKMIRGLTLGAVK